MLEVVLNLAYVISSVLGGWVGGWVGGWLDQGGNKAISASIEVVVELS